MFNFSHFHCFVTVLFIYLFRLSVFLEPIDPARKKHPVNNLEVLTLSYKVIERKIFIHVL